MVSVRDVLVLACLGMSWLTYASRAQVLSLSLPVGSVGTVATADIAGPLLHLGSLGSFNELPFESSAASECTESTVDSHDAVSR